MGDPVTYELVPGHNLVPFIHEESSVMKRAGFIKNHLHVTHFGRKQMFAAGTYPNQSRGGDSLEQSVKENRSIQNEDIVVWYNMGVHHMVRPDDCPVMPTH